MKQVLKRIPMRAIPLLIAVGIGFWLVLVLLLPSRHTHSPLIGKPMPQFMLPRLNEPHQLLMPNSWAGQVAVVNVFASWCQPCKAEHPLLMQLARENGVRLYGIAWRDKPEQVSAYLQASGNPFQIVAVDQMPVTTIPLGILGVPTTYAIDSQGIIRGKWDMPLSTEIIQRELLPLLQQLQAGVTHASP